MPIVFSNILRILMTMLAGYAVGDVVDHILPVPRIGKPAGQIQTYQPRRLFSSVKFWIVGIAGLVVALFLLKGRLKKGKDIIPGLF